jgi:hypothetical protein
VPTEPIEVALCVGGGVIDGADRLIQLFGFTRKMQN